ncbi:MULTISPECIES: LuxR C-terminal-related transcriptional regulator [Enterobacter]|uniref:LuxR C-terminal-related transcriptional regulator n=1 Tax=Enterobacter TaxID=547 RepID=UPI0015EA7F14|nr:MULTISPECIES: LuxR C-terminal-related transcriptional regulator [Enterobacter]HDR2755486.1 response regulator transcription factor [Enterobacter asburiae]QMR77987.1 response regulator transcription factor [Enterobacter sp. RHBSTW-00175]WNT38277.1 LuxR C-terminal-related transcriptional regulator [Enterobacter cloacae]HDR2790888.1 response regulator transcription factor [Enterobacter asburiae]HDR2791583.1 response regulator transcription factor [Enterobacter asburiae]
MLNILIQETDQFFHRGLQCFFVDFFTRNFKQPIHFDVELSRDNVSAADIIVLPFCMGETHICYPELQARQKGIVIGVVDDARRFSASPSCFQDITFISRSASLDRISEVLFLAWYRTQIPGYRWRKKECADCQHKTFSPQQMRMMVNFYRGLSVMQIARSLKMSNKTVFTHKYMMMQKFNLRSDVELIALIRKVMERKT